MPKQIQATETITPEYLRRHGLRVMRYYRDQVVGTVKQIHDFCVEGIYSTEGCEQERFVNILCNLKAGEMVLNDDFDPRDDYFPPKSWEVWQAEDEAFWASLEQ